MSTDKPLPPRLISGGLPPIPAKLVKRIQDGLFVEMAELLAETLISPEYTVDDQSTSSKQKPKEVTNITDWVQCSGLFIAIISLKEPHRIPDLIGYQNLIMRSSVQCQEGCWATYDRRFRLKALAVLISEWSEIDITVWKTAFPERPPTGVSYIPTAPQPSRTSQLSLTGSSASPSRICLEWNENTSPECLRPSCRFDHICYRCVHTNASNKKHKAIFCPYKQKRPRQASNSREKAPYVNGY